jgi:penicillin amidase
MTRWRWGQVHIATFAHPLFSRIPVLRDWLAVETRASGGGDTINRGATPVRSSEAPFRDVHGAGLRMILDFANLDGSRFIITPGQSGNPLSPHYDDLLGRWRDFSWLRLGPDVDGTTLTLAPQ